MEVPTAPRVSQAQYHKPADQPATGHHQINSKPVSAMKTKPATLISQKPAHPQLGQDGQTSISSSKAVNKSQVWDCESSLYDSFELNSFNSQLDSAIKASSRTLSMPHLPQRCAAEPLIPVMTITKHDQVVVPKKFGRVSKLVQKILRSVFRSSKSVNNCGTNSGPLIKAKYSEMHKDRFYVYDGSKSMRVLTTSIPEMHQDMDGHAKFSTDATPVVRRTASERLTATAVGVSCVLEDNYSW